MVERTMRRLQTRYHAATGQHLQWPDCCEGSKTPPYPKNDYYDSVIRDNEQLALDLVKSIYNQLYDNNAANFEIMCDLFSKDTFADIGPPPNKTPYEVTHYDVATDFPQPAAPSMENYPEVLATLDAYILQLDVYFKEAVVGDLATRATNCHNQGTCVADAEECADAIEDGTALAEPEWATGWAANGVIGFYHNQKGDQNPGPPASSTFAAPIVTAGRGRFRSDVREAPGVLKLFARITACASGVGEPDPCDEGVRMGFQPPYPLTRLCDSGQYFEIAEGKGDQRYRSPMFGDTGELGVADVIDAACENYVACWGIDSAYVGVDLDPDTDADEKDCGEDCGNCPAGKPVVSLGSVSIMFPLGRGSSQTSYSAGFIRVRASSMQDWLGKIDGLVPILGHGASEPVQLFDSADEMVLRQFVTPYIMAEFEQTTAGTFTANFYHLADVTYSGDRFVPIGQAQPFSSTVVGFVEGQFTDPRTPAQQVAANRLTIETSGTGSGKWVYTQAVDSNRDDWSLASGYTSGGTPIRIESLLMDPWDEGEQVRTRLISDGTSVVHRQVSTYKQFPWGTERIEVRTGASNAEWTETWSYYDDPQGPAAAYGMLKQYTSATGYWERYEYENQSSAQGVIAPKLAKVVSQFLDGTYDEQNPTSSENANRVVTFSTNRSINLTSGPSHGGNEIIDIRAERLLGQEIARSYTVLWSTSSSTEVETWEIEAAMPGQPGSLATFLNDVCSAPISSEHPVSITVREAGSPYRMLVSVSPDGSISEYTRGTSGGNQILTVETSRVGDNLTPRSGPGASVTTTTRNARGTVLSRITQDLSLGTAVTTSSEVHSNFDEFDRARATEYLDGTETARMYDCCGLLYDTDREGSTTWYTYDELKRVRTTTRLLPGDVELVTEYTYDAAGNVVQERRIPDVGDPVATRTSVYDQSGRLTAEQDALGNVTTYGYEIDSNGLLLTTQTLPDPDYVDSQTNGPLASPVIETRSYPDGHPHSVSGSGAHPSSNDHGVAWDSEYGYCRTATSYQGSAQTQWVRTYTNALGQQIRTEYPGSANAYTAYDTFGRAAVHVDPDGVVQATFTGYGVADIPGAWEDVPTGIWDGRWTLTVQDQDVDGIPDFEGLDRITLTRTELYDRGQGLWVNRSTTIVWTTENDADDLYTTSVSDVTLTGLCAWHEADGQESHTVINYNGSGNKLVTTTDPAGIQVLTSTEHGFQTNLQRKGPSDEPAGATATVYDEHGRVAQTVLDFEDNRPDAVTDYTYDALDRVLSQTEPEPNAASPYFGRRVTSTTYDNLGRVIVVESGTQTTTTSYLPTGEVSEVSGSTNPVRYQYDDLGRLWKLKTYKDASASPWTGEAITTWNYSATRGTLTSKSYNSGGGPAYLYTDAGRVSRKTNQRNIQANYTFNDFGEVSFINYSDTTQDVTLTYDRLGRLKTVKDAAGLRTFTYDNAGRMLTESIASATGAGNLLSGVTVTNAYDTTTKLRTAHTTAKSTLSKTVDYGYDSWRRMDHVQKDTLHARFAYDDVTGQIVSTTYIHNDDDPTGNPHVLGERTHDQLGRLSLLEWTSANTSGAGDIAGFGYEHDADGRRIRMDLTADETYWEYGYDDLGQLASAEHTKDDGQSAVVIPGESSQYIYDDIGNRLAVYEGGGDGQNPYLATYTSNLLNQYTGRDVPGNVEVVGRTSLSTVEDVFVNTEEAWQNGRIFAKRITFNNADDPVVGEIAVEEFAAGPVHIRTSWWDVFLPEDPESFTYDADGNLTLDGVWHYEWDAENRLKSMQMRDEVAAVLLAGNNTWSRLDFAYDWMGRRISKQYSTSTSDPATSGGKYGPPILWSIDKVFRYVYDGWHLSMSYRADGLSGCDPDQSFAWGPDLSGGYGGAGGIGGLVAYTDDEHDALNPAPSDPDFLGPMFPIYDGNGNIVKMIRFEDLGSSTFEAREAAAYEYGPFGENRSTTGELGAPASGGTHQGQRNPFRFSTKYTDAETGLVYYGYRYYSPSMGRWIGRDPIGEKDGASLYAMLANNCVDRSDYLGLKRQIYVFGGLLEASGYSYQAWTNDWQPALQSVLAADTTEYHFYAQDSVSPAVSHAESIASTPPDATKCDEFHTIIALGWSNGGHAAIKFAKRLKDKGIKVDLGWTVDPVPQGLALLTGSSSLQKPSNTDRWINHYQTIGIIKGHPVSGANANTQYKSSGFSRDPATLQPNEADLNLRELHRNHIADPFSGAHIAIVWIDATIESLKDEVRNVQPTRSSYKYP